MGKNKIPLKAIEKRRDMQMTFYKRKRGIIKKAIELSILCETRIFLTMYDNLSGSLITYCSHEKGSLKQLFKTAPDELQFNITNKDYKKMGVEDEIDIQQQKCEDAFQGLGLKQKKLSNTKQKRNEMKKERKNICKMEVSAMKAERNSEVLKEELNVQEEGTFIRLSQNKDKKRKNTSKHASQTLKKNASFFQQVIKSQDQEDQQEEIKFQIEQSKINGHDDYSKSVRQQYCSSPHNDCIKSTLPSPELPQSKHISMKEFQCTKKWQEQTNKKIKLAKQKIKNNLQLGNINLPLQEKQPSHSHTPNTNPMKSSLQNLFGCTNQQTTTVHTPDPGKILYPNTSGLYHPQNLSPFLRTPFPRTSVMMPNQILSPFSDRLKVGAFQRINPNEGWGFGSASQSLYGLSISRQARWDKFLSISNSSSFGASKEANDQQSRKNSLNILGSSTCNNISNSINARDAQNNNSKIYKS